MAPPEMGEQETHALSLGMPRARPRRQHPPSQALEKSPDGTVQSSLYSGKTLGPGDQGKRPRSGLARRCILAGTPVKSSPELSQACPGHMSWPPTVRFRSLRKVSCLGLWVSVSSPTCPSQASESALKPRLSRTSCRSSSTGKFGGRADIPNLQAISKASGRKVAACLTPRVRLGDCARLNQSAAFSPQPSHDEKTVTTASAVFVLLASSINLDWGHRALRKKRPRAKTAIGTGINASASWAELLIYRGLNNYLYYFVGFLIITIV